MCYCAFGELGVRLPRRDLAPIAFGGNTSCVEVVTKSGHRFIFDCGTGARPLGPAPDGAGAKADSPPLCCSATRIGITSRDSRSLLPLFVPGNHFTVCAPQGASARFPNVFAGQMEYTYFPVELGQLGAHIDYKDLAEGAYEIGGVRVTTQFLNHPAATLGYRVMKPMESRCCISATMNRTGKSCGARTREPGKLESILHAGDRRHAVFMENADVVIHDAQYTHRRISGQEELGTQHLFLRHANRRGGERKAALPDSPRSHATTTTFSTAWKSARVRSRPRSRLADEGLLRARGWEETFESDPYGLAHSGRRSVPHSCLPASSLTDSGGGR